MPVKRKVEISQNFVAVIEYMNFTGKSFSEALILTSTDPQYDKRLFLDLLVQYMKPISSEHFVYTNWFLF